MSLGSSLYHARKKSGLSQENVAEKLGVSRQTISKWETNETLPDIRQSKRLAMLYHMTLDELIEYDFDEQQAQQMIESVSDEAQARIDWNKVWSKKYPVLGTYHKTVRINDYAPALREMLTMVTITLTHFWCSKIFWPGYGRDRCENIRRGGRRSSLVVGGNSAYVRRMFAIGFPLVSSSTSLSRYRISRIRGSSISSTLTPHTLPVMRLRFGFMAGALRKKSP